MTKTKISNNWLVILIYVSGLMSVSGLYNPFDDIHLPSFQTPRIKAPDFRMPNFRAPRIRALKIRTPRFRAPHINFRDEYNRLPSILRYNNPRFYRPNVNFNVPNIRQPHINLRDDYNRLPNLPRFNFRRPRFNFDCNNTTMIKMITRATTILTTSIAT